MKQERRNPTPLGVGEVKRLQKCWMYFSVCELCPIFADSLEKINGAKPNKPIHVNLDCRDL